MKYRFDIAIGDVAAEPPERYVAESLLRHANRLVDDEFDDAADSLELFRQFAQDEADCSARAG